jgi:hypothetical protein
MPLYTMTYRERQVVCQGMVEASTFEKAEELGRQYCEQSPQRKYIGMKDAVLIREGQALPSSKNTQIENEPKRKAS